MNRIMTVRALYDALEALLPRSLSCDWDNDGLSVCPAPNAPVNGVLIALDATEEAVAYAAAEGYNVLLSHHPLLFRGVKAVNGADTSSRKIIRLISSGVSAMAFHTRLDAIDGGVNDNLAALLGLHDTVGFGDDRNPDGKPIGRIGFLPVPESLDAFVVRLKNALHTPAVLCSDAGKEVYRVAVLGGGGDDDVEAALAAGADTYVTGDLKYHQLCDAPYMSMNLIAAGHDVTERHICPVLAQMVTDIYVNADLPAPRMHIFDKTSISYR